MIYTITLNPSIDRKIEVDTLELAEVTVVGSSSNFGGKGVNTAIALDKVGVSNCAICLVPVEFQNNDLLNAMFFTKSSSMRENITIIDKNRKSIHLRAKSHCDGKDVYPIFEYIRRNIKASDWVVFSGSVPECDDINLREVIIATLSNLNCHIIVDTLYFSSADLMRIRPKLIKVNRSEFREIFGLPPETQIDEKLLIQFTDKYGHEVILTDGQNEILSTFGSEFIELPIGTDNTTKGNSALGSGDFFIAGFLSGMEEKLPTSECIKLGAIFGIQRQKYDNIHDVELDKKSLSRINFM
ncbi:MAG: PfkB family carbohydrate kinase [Acidobacteriota bacterium]